MSTNTTPTENGFDVLSDSFARQVAESFRLGTDRDGFEHHYWAGADCVVVANESEGVDRVEYLDGRPVAEWESFVADRRGWISHGPFASIGIDYDSALKAQDSEDA